MNNQSPNYQMILDAVEKQLKSEDCGGKVASYISELARISPDKLGMHLECLDGRGFHFGDANERFSIQSISKVFLLTLAIKKEGPKIWDRVDVEPSGDPFNSLVQLEFEKGIPRNPFINAGALVISDMLISALENPKKDLVEFVRMISGISDIDYDISVAASEKREGYVNKALINLIKSFQNIDNDVDEVLDFYFHSCALSMSCRELAKSFLLFANHGKVSDDQILTTSQTKRINAIMQTCGFYDEAGEFSFRVGLPGKSGVGGGIAAIFPGMFSVAVWSPKLNPKGNSAAGMRALELLTDYTGSSIF